MSLPVREMVLYKHGVGFFVRQGHIDGDTTTLTFRHDEINDVLKSLAVFDHAGGHVRGVYYQTPMDREARLANTSIRLSERMSLHTLLMDLRGRIVTLQLEPVQGTREERTGRVIGLDMAAAVSNPDQSEEHQSPLEHTTVTLLEASGLISVWSLDKLRGLQIIDEQAQADLAYALDTTVSEDTRRFVHIQLSEGAHEVVAYYVAPSPVWRVSYRVVAETGDTPQTGRTLIQSWGLFDNRLDEDLIDVKVTLVAGQPISFIYELYASRIPQRPVIQEENRSAGGPVEYQAAEMSRKERAITRSAVHAYAAAPMAAMASWADSSDALHMEEMESAAPALAQGKDTGEFFQYIIQTPVSVKRGDSALVPIMNVQTDYRRELLYNAAKRPTHPVVALRFKNTTGMTLERGPVTIIEDSDYKGEAIVPFTKDGGEVYLPFAVELGIKVTESATSRREIYSLQLKQGYLLVQEYLINATTYVLENHTPKDHTVTIEAPVDRAFELFETHAASEETATHRRWQVSVAAHASANFKRMERQTTQRREELTNLSYKQLQRFFHDRLLDKTAFDQLSDLLTTISGMEQAKKELDGLEAERQQIYSQQEQIRANLGALQSTGKEATLRDRVLTQLTQTQDRLDQIDQQAKQLQHQLLAAKQHVEQLLKTLNPE